MTIPLIRTHDPLDEPQVRALRELLRAGGLTSAHSAKDLQVPATVREILERIRSEGDAAVAELTNRLDGAQLSPETIRVPEERIQQARAGAEPAFLELIRTVIKNITEYQEHIRVRAPEPLLRGGRRLSVRYTPLDRVGVYVPGGRALYPSTVLMTVVPARVAGVHEIVLASPPTGGQIHPLVLALAAELGVREVHQMGGAVAVGALAYGTRSCRPVQKIVGPGNAFVAEAKRQLFGRVGIDAIAGPSEVLILADDSAKPAWIAADLLAQAEHDPGSAILVTPSAEMARRVALAIDDQLPRLERAELIRPALRDYGALIVVPDLAAACTVANYFAPEHLQLMTQDDPYCLNAIRHAGAIFVGPYTPVPLGDYYAGPSHVLPTGGTATFSGPLSCNDFLKASSVLTYDEAGLEQDRGAVARFARQEGLSAHAAAVLERHRKPDPKPR